jgi:hypothetical protein
MQVNKEAKQMRDIGVIIFLSLLALIPGVGFSQSYSDYLILQDISPYKLEAAQKVVGGYIGGPRTFDGAGAIAPTGHFYPDHTDKTYEAYYEGGNNLVSATVQVTKHSGSDSDKWLLHELDDSFRDDFGIPNNSYGPRQINGQTVYVISIGGRGYRWLSGNKVIEVSYHGSLTTLPEPLEVVQAYLAKHPSTLPPITLAQLRSAAKKTTWIKDEMDRRLWLCDKWFMQLQLKKADEKQVYQESVKSMTVFLDYREKYYEVKAADEKNLLAGYLNTNNGTGIKAKLAEYKNWWAVNRDKAIRL